MMRKVTYPLFISLRRVTSCSAAFCLCATNPLDLNQSTGKPASLRFVVLASDSPTVALMELARCPGLQFGACELRTITRIDLSTTIGSSGRPAAAYSHNDTVDVLAWSASRAGRIIELSEATGRVVRTGRIEPQTDTAGNDPVSASYLYAQWEATSDTSRRVLSVLNRTTLRLAAQRPVCSRDRSIGVPDYSGHVAWACPDSNSIATADVPGLHVAALEADSGQSAASPPCVPVAVAAAPDTDMLYVACAKTAELLQLQADSLRLIRRWKIPVAVDRLLAVPGGAHLAGITFDPPRLSVWELAHPRKTAKVVLAGSRATSIAVLNARFLVIGEQTASGSGLLEVVDLADMEKILTAPVSFLVGAIASE